MDVVSEHGEMAEPHAQSSPCGPKSLAQHFVGAATAQTHSSRFHANGDMHGMVGMECGTLTMRQFVGVSLAAGSFSLAAPRLVLERLLSILLSHVD